MADESNPLILGDALESEMRNASGRRRRRRRKKESATLTHCENCGAQLSGPFCAQCGQAAIDYRRSFGTLLADAADAFFNLDARFFQSFGWLLIKPWRLTNEFVEGKRARHVHPLRVYLIASVAFFLVINYLSRNAHFQAHPATGKQPVFFYFDTSRTPAVSPTPSPGVSIDFLQTTSPAPSVPIVPWRLAPKPAALAPNDQKTAFDEMDKDNNLPTFGRWMERRAKEKLGPTGDRAAFFMNTLIANLAPMVLCCIPLFALVLKILYIFKRRFYIEHLVFALHTHAFVFLSTVVIIGLGFLLAWKAPKPFVPIVCVALSFVVLTQLLMAIRRVYRQNWFATLFKFALGSLIYLILLSIAFGITTVITFVLP